jgi:hypothetical protein
MYAFASFLVKPSLALSRMDSVRLGAALNGVFDAFRYAACALTERPLGQPGGR